jgi:hypothetical protein
MAHRPQRGWLEALHLTLRPYLQGAASIFSFGQGRSALYDLPWWHPDPQEADRRALRGDWQAVWDDLDRAIAEDDRVSSCSRQGVVMQDDRVASPSRSHDDDKLS